MLKKIIGTTGARTFIMVISFAIMALNSNALGPSGVGTIGLIFLAITINLNLSFFVSGSGVIVYLLPKYKPVNLLLPSYLWALISSVVGTILFFYFGPLDQVYARHVMLLSLFFAMTQANWSLLLGKQRIAAYNILMIIQIILLIAAILFFYFYAGKADVMAYVFSLHFSYFISFLISYFMVSKYIKLSEFSDLTIVLKDVFKYGTLSQIANLTQLMSYRVNYFIVDSFTGRGALGIYDNGTKLSEGSWLMGKSVATVQYSKIANEGDSSFARDLTIRLMKFTLTITLLIVSALLILPESVYTFILSEGFIGIKSVLYTMAPGILALSVSMIFSHYFTGIGKHYINSIGSTICLATTLIFGFMLIPKYGIMGAGITASIAYFIAMTYTLIMFLRKTKTPINQLLPQKGDLGFFREKLKNLY